jgi:hypothetical protein
MIEEDLSPLGDLAGPVCRLNRSIGRLNLLTRQMYQPDVDAIADVCMDIREQSQRIEQIVERMMSHRDYGRGQWKA